jgi:hypothetical protein
VRVVSFVRAASLSSVQLLALHFNSNSTGDDGSAPMINRGFEPEAVE